VTSTRRGGKPYRYQLSAYPMQYGLSFIHTEITAPSRRHRGATSWLDNLQGRPYIVIRFKNALPNFEVAVSAPSPADFALIHSPCAPDALTEDDSMITRHKRLFQAVQCALISASLGVAVNADAQSRIVPSSLLAVDQNREQIVTRILENLAPLLLT